VSGSFGELIAETRKKKGMSQKELAVSVGVSAPYLNDIEHGRRNPPAEEIVLKLAQILDLPQDHLFLVGGSVPPDIKNAAAGWNPQETAREFAVFRRSMSGGVHHRPKKRLNKE
jgi:transcriptional regulator with XRE-family HTH domain